MPPTPKTFVVHLTVLSILTLAATQKANAQGFGVELHNTVMPASGGMAGASIARPQDVPSAVNGNPATLAQFLGTQFTMSGAWIEPTYKVQHAGGALPGVGAYSATSNAQGAALGNIAVAQDLRPLGIPGTLGIGLIGTSGAGVSFRQVPASNGTSALLQALGIAAAAGVEVTDQLSVGASLVLGAGTLDGPFVGLTGAAYDYALRGSVGVTHELGADTTLGVYYRTVQSFNFDDAAILQLPGPLGLTSINDINLDMPDTIGFGFANEQLLDGRLLLAVDVLYKQWDNADFWRVIWENQWVFQVGAQYAINDRVRVRLGYAYAENITESNPGISAGGVTPPGAQAAIQYIQAQFAAINKHRMTIGVGICDVLPNMDFNLHAGGMFNASEQFGALSSASVESYWLGAGMTWHFGGSECSGCDNCGSCDACTQ